MPPTDDLPADPEPPDEPLSGALREPGTDGVGEDPHASPWSRRMPTTVPGLALGIVVCVVVMALCLAGLAASLRLLTGP